MCCVRGETLSQQTGEIQPMLLHCWASVVDDGATMQQHWFITICVYCVPRCIACIAGYRSPGPVHMVYSHIPVAYMSCLHAVDSSTCNSTFLEEICRRDWVKIKNSEQVGLHANESKPIRLLMEHRALCLSE